MALHLDQSPTYRWKVEYVIPGENGRDQDESFTGVFQRLPQSEIDDLVARANAADGDDLKDREVARELLVGWDGVMSGSGKDAEPVEFSEAMLEKLLELPCLGSAVCRAWLDSVGMGKPRRRTSGRPRGI